MKLPLSRKIVFVILFIAVAVVAFLFISPNSKIDFNAQVKPIFNKKCIACHGGVKQQSGFSLLFREEALANTQSGKPAIIPGHPEKSELIRRITEKNTEERMPYKHDPLSQEEISILKQWIKQGAEWGVHWAYVPVKKQTLPDVENSFIRNDVDRFVLQKLEEEKLQPSPEADKGTLLRRVSLDLTGLPPTDHVAQKFLNDTSSNAYNNLVTDLLATNDYGERWTALWMDLARYGDTKGFESDQGRTIWRYRDWLIKAFNEDKPYNDFLIEQLAGDLMPNADDEKYIATAFHRNTMTNDEGGTDNEEFRTAAVMDRVNTTWSALLGTSFNCVQCHSHPYDPFKHDEYYKFMAFFNNSRDEDTESDYPLLRHFKTADSLKLAKLTAWLQQHASAQQTKEQIHFLKTGQPAINSMQCDEVQKGQVFFKLFLSFYDGGTARLQNVTTQNKNQLIFRYLNSPDNANWSIYLDSLKGPLLKTVALKNTSNKWKIQTISIPEEVAGKHHLYFKYNATLKTKNEPGIMFDWFHFGKALPGKNIAGYDTAAKYFNDLLVAEAETTPVMVENTAEQKRPTYVFERGNWTVKTDEVMAGVPHIMNAMPANVPNNRLGLALWMTDKKNPLTARTMVNRLWEQLFGVGLAETLEDFGTQGMPPTHAQLLDHLSWKFMNEHQWSIKKMLQEIVLSATYRQQSKTNAALIEKDPNNSFLARGPRVRLSGEQLRDQALAVSGLLSKKMYGKSVMPYQPNDIWRSPYNGDKWITSAGEDKNRRAIYTYWKRTAPYPSMMTFDGGSREVCITRRIRTNTPLQALATLNDSAFLIMARHFALRMQQGGKEVNTQIKKGYEAMMYKPIGKIKLNALLDLYNTSIVKFKNNEHATCEVLGEQGIHTKPETAAMVVVANAMLNLDEWVNK